MPAWIHNRAERILRKNPNMGESEAFAIATQQAHALGKTPQGYGTSEGRHTAKKKYRSPSEYQKTAEAQMWSAFFAELEKTAAGVVPRSFTVPKFKLPGAIKPAGTLLRGAPTLGPRSMAGTTGALPGVGAAKATPAISTSVPSFGNVARPTATSTGAAGPPSM